MILWIFAFNNFSKSQGLTSISKPLLPPLIKIVSNLFRDRTLCFAIGIFYE